MNRKEVLIVQAIVNAFAALTQMDELLLQHSINQTIIFC